MKKSALPYTRFAAWLALLAIVLQLAAVPFAGAHMLRQVLSEAEGQLVTICTPYGSKELRVGVDGQPVKKHPATWSHCVFCPATGSLPLQVIPAGASGFTGQLPPRLWVPSPAPLISGAGEFWPWPHGPPRLIAS